jgi:hypothetical protein
VGQFREVGHGGGEHRPHRVDLPGGAGCGHGGDDARFDDARGMFPGLKLEHVTGQRLRLAGLAAQHPVPAEGAHEPQRDLGVPPGDRPPQRGVQVVLFGGQLTEPAALPGAAQPRVGGLGQIQVARGERIPDPGVLACLGQPLQAIRADRLEHPVPWRGPAVRALARGDNRLVDQPGQRGKHLRGRQQLIGADLLGHAQRRAGREHGEPAGQDLLGGREQVPAPVDHGPERPVPGQRGPAAAGKQGEPVVEPLRELGRCQRPQPDGG